LASRVIVDDDEQEKRHLLHDRGWALRRELPLRTKYPSSPSSRPSARIVMRPDDSLFDSTPLAATLSFMPSTHPAVELLTVEDYRATPEGTRYQLIEGDLHMAPAPNLYHQDIVGRFYNLISNFLVQAALGRVFIAPCDVYLSEHDVVQPDVLFVANVNLGILKEDGIHGAPDLVIEVVSPATAQLDKKSKRRIYARAGVKELWLVDPLLLQIQLYDFARDTAKPVRLIEEDETLASPLLPGLTIAAAEIFKR
jgi:Uma2 family endonuclease